MNDNPSFYEKFSEQEMQNLVNKIYSFHSYGAHINPIVWKYTQNIFSDINHYKNEFETYLKTIIIHKSVEGKFLKKNVEELLIMYTEIIDIRSRIMHILEKNWKYVISSKIENKYYLVHADMQIDNLYKHKDGNFELLDFEWVGKSDNPVTAIMYDYGNLRARAWSSPSFQSLLDKSMTEVGKKYYEDMNLINTGMLLGNLRSSLIMCRYRLDFENTVKNDKRTEKNYQYMYPKTISALLETISN